MTTAGGFAFSAAQRMVDRVHHDAARDRTPALVPCAPGLAPVDELPLRVSDLADRRATRGLDEPDLTRRHPEMRVSTLLREELHARTGASSDLRAATRPQLNRVDDGADRDVLERQGVASLDVD